MPSRSVPVTKYLAEGLCEAIEVFLEEDPSARDDPEMDARMSELLSVLGSHRGGNLRLESSLASVLEEELINEIDKYDDRNDGLGDKDSRRYVTSARRALKAVQFIEIE